RVCCNHRHIMDAVTPFAQRGQHALLADSDPERVFAWRGGRPVRADEFLRDVAAVRAHLGTARYCVNLCEDRYRFVVAFAAAVAAQRTTLLPAARTVTVVAELRAAYPDAEAISDETVERALAHGPDPRLPVGPVADAAEVAIGFTSGSTGAPTPH